MGYEYYESEEGYSYDSYYSNSLNKDISSINSENIEIVSNHLQQFGKNAENDIMLSRLKGVLAGEVTATRIDINFINHELREQELMKGGMEYEQAHYQVLKEQGMYYRGYDKELYTQDALDAGNAEMDSKPNK